MLTIQVLEPEAKSEDGRVRPGPRRRPGRRPRLTAAAAPPPRPALPDCLRALEARAAGAAAGRQGALVAQSSGVAAALRTDD